MMGLGADAGHYGLAKQRVTILRDYYVGVHEVTQELWEEVTGENPLLTESQEFGGRCADQNPGLGTAYPVGCVSWNDAVRFANTLSEREGLETCYQSGEKEYGDWTWPRGLDCSGYRLLTDAEWVYADLARLEPWKDLVPVAAQPISGTAELATVAWFRDNADGQAHPVGQKQPNSYGIYDMRGNVKEWVWDEACADQVLPETDPVASCDDDFERVMRGGSFVQRATWLDDRFGTPHGYRSTSFGLRLARSAW